MTFNRVARGRISDNIVAQIRNAIFSGKYAAGDKLPSENELRNLFNVSRVPLREALRSLEQMGLISTKQGVFGGTFVAEAGIKSVSDALTNMIRLGKVGVCEIWDFRLLLEPDLARLAAKRRTERDIGDLENLIFEREKAVRMRKSPAVAGIDFHQVLARAAGNSLATLVMEALAKVLLEDMKKFSFSLSDHEGIIKYHKRIVECLKNKDAEKIGDIVKMHLIDVRRRLKI